MSVFTLGRVGLDVPVDGVSRWDSDGQRVRVAFDTEYGFARQAEVVRQQLLGYTEATDEAYVPVTWSEDPTVDGYYRVLAASVTPDPDLAFLGVYYFEADLERVLGYASPLIETRRVGAHRVNSHGRTNGLQAWGVPNAAKSVAWLAEDLGSGVWIPFEPDLVRATPDGGVKVFRWNSSQHYTSQCYLPPASHYQGAATILMGPSSADADLVPVVGRQISAGDTWRLSNGCVEVEPIFGDPRMNFRIRLFHGSAWMPWVAFSLNGSSAGGGSRTPMLAAHAVTVMRNQPDEVCLRLLTTQGNFGDDEYSPLTIDFTLRRGQRFIAFDLNSVFVSDWSAQIAALASSPNVVGTQEYYWKDSVSNTSVWIGAPDDIMGFTGGHFVPASGVAAIQVTRWRFAIGVTNRFTAGDSVDEQFREYLYAGSSMQTVVAQ